MTQVGPRHDRRFKVLRTNHHHLMRNKSRQARLRGRRLKYIHVADEYRVKKMLPYWRRQKFKYSL